MHLKNRSRLTCQWHIMRLLRVSVIPSPNCSGLLIFSLLALVPGRPGQVRSATLLWLLDSNHSAGDAAAAGIAAQVCYLDGEGAAERSSPTFRTHDLKTKYAFQVSYVQRGKGILERSGSPSYKVRGMRTLIVTPGPFHNWKI